MRAICANVHDAATRQNWPGWTTSQTKVMHFDKDFKRSKEGVRSNSRRGDSCPTNWITTRRGTGARKCPLPNGSQPSFQTEDTARQGVWQAGVMYKEIDASGLGYDADSINEIGRPTVNTNAQGTIIWENTGVIFTWYVIICAYLIEFSKRQMCDSVPVIFTRTVLTFFWFFSDEIPAARYF